jgi:hypothetical protein
VVVEAGKAEAVRGPSLTACANVHGGAATGDGEGGAARGILPNHAYSVASLSEVRDPGATGSGGGGKLLRLVKARGVA